MQLLPEQNVRRADCCQVGDAYFAGEGEIYDFNRVLSFLRLLLALHYWKVVDLQ